MHTRRCTFADAFHIAAHLREADRQECDALTALPPVLSLPAMLHPSRRAYTAVSASGDVIGMGGVDRSMVPGVGIVWFVATDAIYKHRTEFLRDGRSFVDALNAEFPVLTNFVDARNTLHHRWLKWLGFVFLQRIEKWGARSAPFIEFARHKPCA